MLSLNQTARIISTYASDTSGVCSALYELGGMTVMHDASGCNSTYNTHDEPRWYDTDSLVFISALAEKDAILGADEKLISDVVSAAKNLKPRFTAVCGTPIPMMTGCDFDAVAYQINLETSIPSFGFATDGMHSYVKGADMAFAALAAHPGFCPNADRKSEVFSVNLLGITPLDFSVNNSHADMEKVLEAGGVAVNSSWAMGPLSQSISKSSEAHINLVVSGCGISAAKIMEKRFGIPYVVATPIDGLVPDIIKALNVAAQTGKSNPGFLKTFADSDTVIIGEGVTSLSLANALFVHTGKGARVVCATDISPEFIKPGFVSAIDEDDIIPLIKNAKTIVADPLYRPICPENAKFVSLPHEGFSGRIYRKEIPNLIKNFNKFRKENEL